MSKERDHGSGRYVEKATLDDVLDAVDAVDGPPVATTADVADATGISRDTARRKLETLRENGRVERRETAGRAMLYWPADESPDGQTSAEKRETGESVADTAKGSTAPTDGERTNDSADTRADVVDRVADAENWADDHRLDDRKAAARAVLDYAREHGTVSQQEAKEQVCPEHSVGGQDPRTWYRKTIRPVLNEAAEYDNSARAYRLAGPDQDG